MESDHRQRLAGVVLNRVEEETFVAAVEAHACLPSTNDRALEHSTDDTTLTPLTPLLVITKEQTAGRGRGGNRWWSGEGALTFSLLIDAVAADRLPQLSLTAGVAVCEALRALAPRQHVGLKWPNDVYLDGKKICGILVEIPPGKRGHAVLGIGLNVNNSSSSAPDELRRKAISLREATGEEFCMTTVLIRVLQLLEQQLDALATHDPRLAARWEELSILRGRTLYLAHHGHEVTGVCQGIDEEGGLLLRTPSGIERIVGGVIRRFE